MELQWLLLARAFRINQNGTLDIAQVFQKVTVEGVPRLKADVSVLAKVKFDLLRVGEETNFTFRLENPETGDMVEMELPYEYPPFDAWLRGAGCYINLNLADVEFATSGEHVASVWYDGKLLASETFIITNE